jgi:PAS domain S-box-containing protein
MLEEKDNEKQPIPLESGARRRAEEEIRRERDRAQTYLDLAGVVIVALDAEGRVTLLNRKGCKILGCSADEALGKNWFETFLPAAIRGQVRTVFRSLMEGKLEPVEYFENPILTRSGKERLIAWQNTVLKDAEGRIIGTLSSGSDIAERKKAEKALTESEERYRLLIERQREGLTIVDLEEQFVFCNPAGDEIFGVPRGGLVGRNVREFTTTETFELIRKQTEKRLSGESSSYEIEITHPDGEKRQLLTTATPWLDKDGRIVGALAIFRDETERKQAEEALRENEKRFRHISSTISDIAYSCSRTSDGSYSIDWMMGAAERIIGCSMEEIQAQGCWRFLVVDEDQVLFERWVTGLAPGSTGSCELRLRQKSGGIIWVASFAECVIEPENPDRLRLYGGLVDITERKRMEQELIQYSEHLERLVEERTRELRSARERLDYLIKSNPAVIYSGKPLADHSDFLLTYLSERVASMLGFEPQDFIGHPEFWERHVPPEDKRSVLAEVPRLWKEGQHTFEYRFLHKDGTYRWIREEAKVVRDADGKPVEVNGYWTDITERKRMEEALLRSQRLATIGELAAMVGHDLRNPLEAIAGASYLLRKGAAGTISETSRESLQIIERSIDYSDKIINDLLEYSAEIKLQQSATDPRSITGDALSLVRIPENIQVVNRTQTEPKILVDANKVRRVFLNIIRNAVDAMPQGGTLMISSRQTGGDVELVFTDMGAGMTKETLSKLWTPLFTTKPKGMGFGLAISKRIVEAHGGSILADSTFSKGSTFTVKLPIKSEEVKES